MDTTPPRRPPDVPGLRLSRLLGAGGHGEVWAARDAATGADVAVKVSPDTRLLAPELAVLGRIDHPHVLRMIRVVPVGGGSAMVLELAEGGSLALLVARRGRLGPGEVSTMLVPLAAAVEHLHRRGLAHGDLTPGNVLFAAGGKPLLGDLGAARLIGTTAGKPWHTPGFLDPATAAGADPRAVDVWGLGAVAWFALTARAPSELPEVRDDHETSARAAALVRLIADCLSPDPQSRPEPTDIARRAWDAARPLPIRLARAGTTAAPGRAVPASSAAPVPAWSFSQQATTPPAEPGTAPEPEQPQGRAGWLGRVGTARSGPWVLALCGVSLALLAAAVAVPGYLRHGEPTAPRPAALAAGSPAAVPAATSAQGAQADLTRTLDAIAAARARAFSTASAAALADADEPGSPAATADEHLVRRLRQAGRRLDGLRFRMSQVHLDGAAGGVRTVSALVSTSAYRQVRSADGASVTVAAEPPRRVRLVLAPVGDGWRVRSTGDAGAGR